MRHASGRRTHALATALALAALAAAGCSSGDDSTDQQIVAAASAAQSPPVTIAPSGTVYQFARHGQMSACDPQTATVLVLADNGTSVSVFATSALQAPRHTIGLPQPATGLASDGKGLVYLSTTGGYYRVDLAAGRASKVDVPEQQQTAFTAIARRADGTLTLGDAAGVVYTLAADNRVTAKVGGFTHIDSLAAQGSTVIVLDRAQSSVTTLTSDGTSLAHALRAGDGATTMLADNAGRLLVADTRGGALLVFGTDSLILRQRYPIPNSPYGLAASPKLSWVSQTATNTVIGYDLSTGIPVERARYSTVRQPDSLTTDGSTLYVVSSSGDGIQAIDIRSVG